MAVMQVGKYRDKIIIEYDRDKDKNVKSKNQIEDKNRDDIKKSSSHQGKIINNNDKKKCEDRAADIKCSDKFEDRDRNNINTELSKDDIYEEILSKSRTSNRNIGF